jgi:hypothetical protein
MTNKVPIGRMQLPFFSASESTSQIRADYDRIVFLANRVLSFIRPWQPSDGAVPMTSLTRKKGGRRWRWLTVGRAQAIIAVVCLYLGVFVAAFRFSVQSRLYGYKALIHSMAEDSALKFADEENRVARRCLELARLIARDSRLDAEGYSHAWSRSLAQKHPRLEAANRQTLTLSEVERRDVLQGIEDSRRIYVRNAEHGRGRAASHAQLKRKYEHAAFYPWMPPEPDPPLNVQGEPF